MEIGGRGAFQYFLDVFVPRVNSVLLCDFNLENVVVAYVRG